MVNIYKDGSVLVQHGGVEMGQGLNTKLAQLAANTLSLPLDLVRVATTHTQVIPNASATAASASTDLYGQAVVEACEKLKRRLSELKVDTTDSWQALIRKAYLERVSLSAAGFYATPQVGFDWNQQKAIEEGGSLFRYFTWGVALSSVELDCLTGRMRILSTRLAMDLGSPLNAALDRGQIEGAWMQGVGLFCLEQSWWSPLTGRLLTNGPAGYKIPTMAELPPNFQVEILPGIRNPLAVAGSKAVGEPPLFLAAALHLALRQAIQAHNQNGFVRLDSPASAERCRLALNDEICLYAQELMAAKPPATPWGIPI